MKKFISVVIVLVLIMNLGTFVAASAATLVTPTEVINFAGSGGRGITSTRTMNGAQITVQQYNAEINQIYQGATQRLISFDATIRSGTTESSGAMTRSAALASLNSGQAWGPAYRAILNGTSANDFSWAGNSVAIHDITGNGIPDLIFATGESIIEFFVYSFDGNRANRIIHIEQLGFHVSNNSHDAYVTSDGALIVRSGNGGDDGRDYNFGETFYIFRDLTPQSQLPPAVSATPISVYLDGTPLTFDVPPQTIDGRILVPLRAIFEALGAGVDWNEATRVITATKDGTTVVLTIGSNTATVNGQSVTLDVPPQVIDGRTLVPLRFVAESFGVTVDWDGSTRTVTITSPPEGTTPPTQPPTQPPASAQTAVVINPEIFDILGMTFNEIVARHGGVMNEDWYAGGYTYTHERGLGEYIYSYNFSDGLSRPVVSERDRETFRLSAILTTAQNLFSSSFTTLNRSDLQRAFGVNMGEITRNEMYEIYQFYFTYRNAIVSVQCDRDGTVRSNSTVWVSRLSQ